MKNKQLLRLVPVLVALVLLLWNLWDDSVNLYYAAGVYSMRQSWHAFFFNSLDSVGFISIDKPPLGLWIQTITTLVFGFNNFALLLPQIVATLLSVYLIFKMVEKKFGFGAGFAAALVLASTPIFIAVGRNNTQDSVMILFLLLASHYTFVSLEREKPFASLVAVAFWIGAAFNVKMLAAYMMVPAIYLTYFLFAKGSWKKRFFNTLSSGLLALAFSFSWAVIVDLIPTSLRPYVGGSENNSVINLIFGYNGWNRLFVSPSESLLAFGKRLGSYFRHVFEMMLPPPPGDDARGLEAGAVSIFRLFNPEMAGQISWFLIPSIWTVARTLRRWWKDRSRLPSYFPMAFFWSLNGMLMFVYFSFSSGLAHLYYLAEYAPVLAALTGVAFQDIWSLNEKSGYWIPASLGAVGIVQILIQSSNSAWLPMLYIILAASIVSMTILSVVQVKKSRSSGRARIALPLLVLLAFPLWWAATPAIYGSDAQLPVAGPELIENQTAFSTMPDYTVLIDFLKQEAGDATFLACVPSSMDMGNALILQSEGNIMVLGGFRGDDEPISLTTFQDYISRNIVRLAVVPRQFQSNSAIITWIQSNKTVIREFINCRVYSLA